MCELIINSFLPDLFQKYTIANTKFSSEFKLYNPSVPAYLHNRPHYFVKHCMLRIHSAKSDFQSGDIAQHGPTTFSVKSKGAVNTTDTLKKWWYDVQLGNDSVFPNCECADFQRHYLPCKHFFAIFHLMPEYSWESLPQYFRESTFITIDNSFISHNINKRHSGTSNDEDFAEQPSNGATTDTFNDPANGDDVELNDASPDRSPSSHKGGNLESVKIMSEKLRSNLKLLVDFSHTSKDHKSLRDVNNQITKVLCNAMSTLPSEDNLYLRCSPKKKTSASIISKKYFNLRNLPMKKKNKKLTLYEKYKNRVGVFAEKVKKASHIQVSEEKTKENYRCDEFQCDSSQDYPSKSNNLQQSRSAVKGKV